MAARNTGLFLRRGRFNWSVGTRQLVTSDEGNKPRPEAKPCGVRSVNATGVHTAP